MNWTTLYITGRRDFREEVRRKLEGSELNLMPGYIENSGRKVCDLFWVDETVSLREIKEAVGSKLIWKYRLRFFINLEEFIHSMDQPGHDSDFTDDEQELLTAMRQSA